MYYKLILDNIKKYPTDIYGLKWRPSLESNFEDNNDWPITRGITVSDPDPPFHFSDLDQFALNYAYNKLKILPRTIVEIGVDRSGDNCVSSTETLLKLKSDDCVYIGIDIEDKSYLNDVDKKIYTIQMDSADKSKLYDLLDQLNIMYIDFMFVDGWHSINQVLQEWQYWERMSSNGIMAFHDTNYHRGPVAVLDAVDTNIFSVEYFGRDVCDWGVAVVQRL